jgi:hypothetical protein
VLPGGRSQPCLWCWRSVSQRGVWSDGVGVDAPALGQHAQFFDRVEEFAVEELVAQLGVEAFPVAVLPGRAGFEVQSLCAGIGESSAQVFGDELRPVV